jgi:hypothetical protein
MLDAGKLYRPSERWRRWILAGNLAADRNKRQYVGDQVVSGCLSRGWVSLLHSEFPQVVVLSDSGRALAKQHTEPVPRRDDAQALGGYLSATEAQRKALRLALRTGTLRLWSRNVWVPGDHTSGRPTKSGSIQSKAVRSCIVREWLTLPAGDTTQGLVTSLTSVGCLIALACIAASDNGTEGGGGDRKRRGGPVTDVIDNPRRRTQDGMETGPR